MLDSKLSTRVAAEAAPFVMHEGMRLGGTPREDGDAGLDEFEVVVPERAVLDQVARRVPASSREDGSLAVKDPDGIRITIRSSSRIGTPLAQGR